MAQPGPSKTRQSGPEAKEAPVDALHAFAPGGKPGGPILPGAQGYVNPGPTKNLRGVEENTNRSKGDMNPRQHGTTDLHGDHDPGTAQAGMDHGRQGDAAPGAANERTADKSTKVAPPEPDPMGVRK